MTSQPPPHLVAGAVVLLVLQQLSVLVVFIARMAPATSLAPGV
jgi:hypothetical protein